MPWTSPHGLRLLAATAALVVPAVQGDAQIIQVSAGASTLYGAEGGDVRIRGQKMEASLGGGFVGGSFTAGGALLRKLPLGTLVLGQQELHMDLPTDIFDTAHFLFATGLGVSRATRRESMQAFLGYASQEGGTPLFRAATLGKPTQYLQWSYRLNERCGLTATELLGAASAALASVQCAATHELTLAGSAGMGGASPYVAVSAVLQQNRTQLRASYSYANDRFERGNNPFQPTPEPVRENVTFARKLSRDFSLSATHGNALTPAGEPGQTGAFTTGTVRSSLDSLGLLFHRRRYGAGVSFLRSAYHTGAPPSAEGLLIPSASNSALSASFRYTRQRWQFSQLLLHTLTSTASDAQATVLSNTAEYAVSPRLRLTETVNLTNHGQTFSHGGTLLTRFSTLQVEYQFFYLATRPDRPFEQGLLLNAEIALPAHFGLHATSTVDALGHPLYTVQLGKLLVHDAAGSAMLQTRFGESVVRGRVLDERGGPVDGAVLKIGEQRLYTDSEGYFQFREKRPASHPLLVMLEEFTGPGAYQVVSAPQTVRSAPGADSTPVRVVVSRVLATEMASVRGAE